MTERGGVVRWPRGWMTPGDFLCEAFVLLVGLLVSLALMVVVGVPLLIARWVGGGMTVEPEGVGPAGQQEAARTINREFRKHLIELIFWPYFVVVDRLWELGQRVRGLPGRVYR